MLIWCVIRPSRRHAEVQSKKKQVVCVGVQLEVAGRVDTPIRIPVIAQRTHGSARGRCPLFLVDAIVLRIGNVIVLWQLLSLLLAPQPPGNDSQTTDQDRTTDTADHASDDLLTTIGKRGTAAAAVLQGRGDGGCCKAGRTGYDTVGSDDGAVGGAIAGPERCRCGWDGL